MAKMTEWKKKPTNNELETNVEQSTEEIVVKPTEKKSDSNLQAILERLERLEQENKELKSNTATKLKDAKKVNNDPKKFSYKLRG